MNRKNLTEIGAAIVLGGALTACCPYGEEPASSAATSNATLDTNAAAPAAADTSTAPPDTTTAAAAPAAAPAAGANNGTTAAPATPGATEATAGAGAPGAAGAPEAAAAAAPSAGSGTISGQITTTPAKFGNHVVVWLDGGGLPANPVKAEIDQQHMMFSPYLTAIPAGGKIIFRNSDPFPHNVFSSNGDKFNLGMMPAKSARVHAFDKVGSYTLLCQIHPGMIAYIYVVPSKYYAIADSKGNYTIKNVANGSYKLSAWAPKLAVSTANVTVSGGTATASLNLRRGN
jgi:plastocyanin